MMIPMLEFQETLSKTLSRKYLIPSSMPKSSDLQDLQILRYLNPQIPFILYTNLRAKNFVIVFRFFILYY